MLSSGSWCVRLSRRCARTRPRSSARRSTARSRGKPSRMLAKRMVVPVFARPVTMQFIGAPDRGLIRLARWAH